MIENAVSGLHFLLRDVCTLMSSSADMDYDKLETLSNLRRSGEISEEEFNWEKERLRADKGSPFARGHQLNLEENNFLMLLHLTQFCGMLIPLIGSVIPVFLWLNNKDRSPKADLHGRIVFNWMFSFTFYLICSLLLSGAVIGLVTLGVLLILNVIFVMVGTFRARNGKIFEYPFSIQFFKVKEQIAQYNQAV